MKRAYLLILLLFPLGKACCQETIQLSGDKPCGLTGNARSEKVKKLNLLKNRYNFPAPADFDKTVTLSALLKPGKDEKRFSDKKAVRIRGYVIDVKTGGKETCNCYDKEAKYRDTHIELVRNRKDTAETRRLIVEVTPRFRKMMALKGKDWSTETLKKSLKYKWITVEGWLMFDTEHRSQAENTSPGNPRNWRATGWEIHPVTSIILK
jgi:hypothetical protein